MSYNNIQITSPPKAFLTDTVLKNIARNNDLVLDYFEKGMKNENELLT